MNKRFTFIFIKYISIFVALSFLVIMAGMITFALVVNSVFSTSVNELSTEDLIYAVEERDDRYSFSKDFQQDLNDSNYAAYIVNNDADVIYPSIDHNLKNKILDNLYSSVALPFKEDEHMVLINKGVNNTPVINNKENINTTRLIDSLYSHNYNQYDFHIEDGNLEFTESMTQQSYSYVNEFTDGDITLYKFIGILFVLIPLILMLLTIIMSIILTRKLSKPLFFYADWLSQLSNGLLYKPSTVQNLKKSKKMYKELDDAVESLNSQLLHDRLYQNQIDYYRNQWLGQISHDLKSPLTSIYGYAKVMPYFPNEQKKYALLISDKAKYMENLIDSLNSNFKWETAQMEVSKDMFSLIEVVNDIKNTVGYDKLELTADLDDEYYYGNKLYIGRMFINLVDNSLDHNKVNPNISIHLSDGPEGISIIYKDDGTGINSEAAQKLMTHGESTKTDKENHGIGFSIIHDAINFHDGSFVMIPEQSGVHFQIILR